MNNHTEAEATAWAFAAVRHLQLEPSILFHSGGYRGASLELITTYTLGVYPGAFGLSQAGMTHIGAEAVRARGSSLSVHVAMATFVEVVRAAP